MTRTSIEWATDSWNPIAAYDRDTGKRGWFCEKVSPGCTHCYAEKINQRLGNGHLYRVGNRAKLRFELAPTLTAPLRWRKPRRVFVNSMTDLFFESHTEEMIDQVFAIMALAPQHQFLVLTKRPERMLEYFYGEQLAERVDAFVETIAFERTDPHNRRTDDLRAIAQDEWPLPNVWLGVSVENQQQAHARIPLLLRTPAAIRFLSCEPLLGSVDLTSFFYDEVEATTMPDYGSPRPSSRGLSWVVAGGESGPDARPCDVDWIRSIVKQCDSESVPCFVKQLGAKAYDSLFAWKCVAQEYQPGPVQSQQLASFAFDDPKGGDPKEWPTELRVRQYPKVEALV